MVHREHIHIITILASATVVQVTTTLPGTRDRNKTKASALNLSTDGCYRKRTIFVVRTGAWNELTATTARRYRRKRLQVVSTTPIAIAATGADSGCGILARNGWQLKAAPQLVAQDVSLGCASKVPRAVARVENALADIYIILANTDTEIDGYKVYISFF